MYFNLARGAQNTLFGDMQGVFEFLWIENKEKERLLAFNAAVCAFNVFTYKVKKKKVSHDFEGARGLKE